MALKLLNLFVLGGSLVFLAPIFAQLPFAVSDAEVTMLPPGCQTKLRGTNPTGADWALRVGEGAWPHLHHYCYGLNFINRARLTNDKTNRRFYLQSSIGEFGYVLDHSPATSPIISEVKARKAEAEAMLKMQ